MAENGLDFAIDIGRQYVDKAQKAQAGGNYSSAKEYYTKAAEQFLIASKKCTGKNETNIRRTYFAKAQSLLNCAKKMDEYKRPSRVVRNTGNNQSDPNDSQAEQEEDEGKNWVASDIPNIKFEDVAGLEDVKHTIMTRMINPIRYPEKYAAYGKKSGGGVLLYGPPGTGKTMIAKAIAGEVGATFYAVKSSDILSKWVGESEKNIASLFEATKKDKLAIIFIDEMDSLFAQRGVDAHNDKRVNEFLQQIDGFASKTDNLLILGATNNPWAVDSAAVRSGRFSEKIYVHLPDAKARKYLFTKQLQNVPLSKDVNIDKLVDVTEGYSGADLAEVCDRAKEEPLENYIKTDKLTPLTMKNFIEAIKKVPPTVKKSDVAKFEAYAGISNKRVENTNKELDEIEEEIKEENINGSTQDGKEKDEGEVQVSLASDVIKLQTNEKPQIEFSINKDYERVYVNIDGANYVCSKKFNSWITDPLAIQEPGEYEMIISSNDVIFKGKIKFIKGLEEEDLGL